MSSHIIEKYFDRLWPLCRSITGPGYRQSFDILSELVPYKKIHFKTGKKIFDWTVPKEWIPKSAYIIDPNGKKRADFSVNNLHLLGYSTPIRTTMSLEQLKPHLYSLPRQSRAIPYVTSYYKQRWGFCLTHQELKTLPQGNYRVVIDTEFRSGSVQLGEAVLSGKTDQEILIWTYLCHPSMANNELSGPLVSAFLYKKIATKKNRKFTYRFVIGPETIGSLCYLSLRGEHLKKKLAAGFVVTCVGDNGKFTYKLSRRGDSIGDQAAREVLKESGPFRLVPFVPFGSDERQFCSPGFDLPVGSLMRTMYGQYPQYHTSLDNKSFINFSAMGKTVGMYARILQRIEQSPLWKSRLPYGEPFLGKRGLYSTLGTTSKSDIQQALMWILNFSDGKHTLSDISDRSGISVGKLSSVIKQAKLAGLIDEV